jgi:hypothetical protein
MRLRPLVTGLPVETPQNVACRYGSEACRHHAG